MDGAMIDLKCFDPAIHLADDRPVERPGAAQHRTARRLGLLYEVRLLILAGVNDRPVVAAPHRRVAGLARPGDAGEGHRLPGHGARPHDPDIGGTHGG